MLFCDANLNLIDVYFEKKGTIIDIRKPAKICYVEPSDNKYLETAQQKYPILIMVFQLGEQLKNLVFM